jgi:hypothetical protein
MNLTAAAAQSLPTARERAMATDLLDAEPVTRLTEDEPDVDFLNELDEWDAEAEWLANSDFEQAEREFFYRAGRF